MRSPRTTPWLPGSLWSMHLARCAAPQSKTRSSPCYRVDGLFDDAIAKGEAHVARVVVEDANAAHMRRLVQGVEVLWVVLRLLVGCWAGERRQLQHCVGRRRRVVAVRGRVLDRTRGSDGFQGRLLLLLLMLMLLLLLLLLLVLLLVLVLVLVLVLLLLLYGAVRR